VRRSCSEIEAFVRLRSREASWRGSRPACPSSPRSTSRRLQARSALSAGAYFPSTRVTLTRRPRPDTWPASFARR
jgi:hypothetical protein